MPINGVVWVWKYRVTLLFAFRSLIVSNKKKCIKVTSPHTSSIWENHCDPLLNSLSLSFLHLSWSGCLLGKKLSMMSRSHVIYTHLIMLDQHVEHLRNTNAWRLALSSILNRLLWPSLDHTVYRYRMPGRCLYTQCNTGHIREICVVLNTALIGPHLDHLCPAVTHYSAMSWPCSPTTQDLFKKKRSWMT